MIKSINNIVKLLDHIPKPMYDFIIMVNMFIKINISRCRHRKAFKFSGKIERVNILFIVCSPQGWNSLKTVYQAAKKNTNVNTYVVIFPDSIKLEDGKEMIAYDFFELECENAIRALDSNGRLLNLEELKPHIVFRQSPYDKLFPLEYSMSNLAQFSKTCYVPYNYNFAPNHLDIEYNFRLLRDTYAIFADCLSNLEYCETLRRKWYPDLHVYYLGFPRFDLIRRMGDTERKDNGMTFTWIPRWSVDEINNDGTSFFKYKDLLIDFFSTNKELNLIIRPHPLMFGNFVKLGIMSKNAVEDYKKRIASIPNIWFDENIDYLDTFVTTDVLIADMSSIVYEFYLLGKPIIYCGNPSHFNDETKTMIELMYKVTGWEELKYRIEILLNGIDKNRVDREKDIGKVWGELPRDIGESIINKCIELVHKEN